MQILILSDAFPPEVWGGAELSSYELGLALSKKGHEVSVLTLYTRSYGRKLNGFKQVEKVVHRSVRAPFFREFNRWELGSIKMANRLKRLLSVNDFDIIHVNGPVSAYALLWAYLSHIHLPRRVLTIRNPWPFCPLELGYCVTDYLKTCLCESHLKGLCAYYLSEKPRWLKSVGLSPYVLYKSLSFKLIRSSLKVFDRLVAISNFLREAMVRFSCASREKIHVIYNGMNNSFFEEKPTKTDNTIVYVGRITPDKGIHHLIKAMKLVSENYSKHRLLIVGKGPYEPRLKKLVEELGLKEKVLFLGFIPPKQVRQVLRTAEFLVHPTIYPEPFGRSIVEAMSAGKPVVAAKTGAIPEIVRDEETGLLVNPMNSVELANAICYLIENPSIASEMGMKARLEAKAKYSIDRMTDQYIRLFERLLAS